MNPKGRTEGLSITQFVFIRNCYYKKSERVAYSLEAQGVKVKEFLYNFYGSIVLYFLTQEIHQFVMDPVL